MKQTLTLIFSYTTLILSSIFIDFLLHTFHFDSVGRYLGILGTILILLTFLYSLRKKGMVTEYKPKQMLKLHEVLGWIGGVLIVVHSGIHFNAFLPWVATFALLVVVASGHVGKYLLKTVREQLKSKEKELKELKETPENIEQLIFWESTMVSIMSRWRVIHIPFVVVFILLASAHILTILFYWNW